MIISVRKYLVVVLWKTNPASRHLQCGITLYSKYIRKKHEFGNVTSGAGFMFYYYYSPIKERLTSKGNIFVKWYDLSGSLKTPQNTSKPSQTTFLTPRICFRDSINNWRRNLQAFLLRWPAMLAPNHLKPPPNHCKPHLNHPKPHPKHPEFASVILSITSEQI